MYFVVLYCLSLILFLFLSAWLIFSVSLQVFRMVAKECLYVITTAQAELDRTQFCAEDTESCFSQTDAELETN